MFKWKLKAPVAKNAIYLEDSNGKEGRPFKSRFLQAGLVKYDFGVCLLQKETIDKFINTFIGVPVIVDHKDSISPDDIVGEIQNIWFSTEDGWFWCSGVITDEKAIELIESGYNVSCQYRITDYIENTENKLHNGNPYDKEILNGVFEHLAIVKNPRYEGAFIAANAYIASNDGKGSGNFDHDGRPGEVGGSSQDTEIKSYYNEKTKTIELKGDELGSSDEEIREKGLEYFKKHYQGKTFNNPKLEKVLFSAPGIKKFKKNSADIHKIKAIPALKDIIEKGEYKGPETLKHPREDGIVKFHRINHNVSIDGEIENMSILIAEDKNGNRFYNLNNRTYTAENSSRGNHAKGEANEEFHINIIASNSTDFNPIDFINDLDKGGLMSKDLKELCGALVEAFMRAKNEADEEKEKTDEEKEKEEKEKEAENKAKNEEKDAKDKEETASNEDTDKRKLIDEIGGILKGKVDEELWRTIIGKAEKLAYTKSEAGTADNKAKNKCKNEDEEKEDEYEELKEKVYEEVKNKKASNSLDELKSVFFQGEGDMQSSYQTREDRLEAGMKY